MNKTYYLLLLVVSFLAMPNVHAREANVQPELIHTGEYLKTQLHLSSHSGKRPLVLTLAGSSGGFAYEQEPARVTQLTSQGFHVLRAAYVVPKPQEKTSIPTVLSRIRLESFGEAIDRYLQLEAIDAVVDRNAVGILGTSKGAELALLLASRDSRYRFVVAVVPSNVVFQAPNTTLARHSPWTFGDQEIDFVPYPHFSIASLYGLLTSLMGDDINVNFSWMHTVALKNRAAVKKATIPVEKINGPILLISGFRDQWWPSTKMSHLIMARLREKQFLHLSASHHILHDADHYPLKDQPERFQAMIDRMATMVRYRRAIGSP